MNFEPAYHHLDAGKRMEEFIPMRVREARAVSGPSGKLLQMESVGDAPTIDGVEVTQAQTFINERRVLVVSHNSEESPGTLGYSVVLRPGCALGDHYHHKREERILILHGQAEFRLQDCRPLSGSHQLINLFTLDYPGACVRVPAGVAHSIYAQNGIVVLQVLASNDYDPADDVHVQLSAW